MIDRIYTFALLFVLVLFQRDLLVAGGMVLLLAVFLVAIPTFAFEALAQFLAPQLQRDLIVFRYKPKRGVQKLIRHLSLDVPRTAEEQKDRAQRLARAANAVTMRHPNPFYGPVRLKRLEKALGASLIPANRAFAGELRRAWIAPKPGLSPGGLILHLRAAIGRVLFGRWLAVARTQSLTGASTVVFGLKTHKPDEPWKTPNYPDVMTFLAWRQLADAHDLRAFGSDPGSLPLRDQRLLAAVTAQLHGTPTQALVARLLSPSHYRALAKLAADRKKWQPWQVTETQVQAQQSAERATEQAQRQVFRKAGSLTPDEVAALVSATGQDTILLNRVWPPGAAAPGNSWLGGLPCLPPDMDWPRHRETGLPLHFLAQVDCADLPTLGGTSPLPRDGLLLFFSDLDEERLSENDAVVYVPKSRQSVPPRALPDALPEIDHSGGKPSIYTDEPGKRHYPKWPVVPVVVKTWGGETEADPKTFNIDYLEQSHAAQEASIAAVMPPQATSSRMGDLFPRRQRKDAFGKTIVTADGKAIPYTVFDAQALPPGFPFCGAGARAFVARLQMQAEKQARRAASSRSMITAKWNDTEEKRARKRAEAEKEEAGAKSLADLAGQAQKALGDPPALAPISAETSGRLLQWLTGLPDTAPDQCRAVQQAVSAATLDLARAAVTDPGLLRALPPVVFEMHATSLVPSPRHSQHLMLGPAQRKTNSTAGQGVRLLCLDSDYGPGMMFCDCGVLEYWIDPKDLAARRFDRAVAQTAGS
ncbi:DUF1963 domain-containing protein [Tabrizicola aquatica]|uniref:DUF1963 domain-containing protein n=1 Tax=Tabrizicola aquatica TaxID=909926 RepID=UPI0011AFA559|nr:DUF1963 domain-containing protein [Tabrizicola aquatica]